MRSSFLEGENGSFRNFRFLSIPEVFQNFGYLNAGLLQGSPQQEINNEFTFLVN